MECRRQVSFELLRDDLAVYLKILQSAMIELINKDYADFVNLSGNLVCILSSEKILLELDATFIDMLLSFVDWNG